MATITAGYRTRFMGRTKMSDFDKQVNTLLKEAMKQPGVAEVMKLYEGQQQALKAHAKAQAAVATRWVMSASSSSGRAR